MKIFSLVLILFSFFAAYADGIICIGHDFYETNNATSLIKAPSSTTETDFSPFDHCEVCPDSCNVSLVFLVHPNDEIFYLPSSIKKDFFVYKDLKLNTFLSLNDRPPALV